MAETSQSFEKDLLRLFDLSDDLFYVVGFDGYFRRINRAWERSLGYTEEELLGTHHLEITHPDDRESAREALSQLGEGKDLVRFEARLIGADGSPRWLEWTATTRPEEGFIYGVGRDVTERRQATAEMTALRRVATLVAQRVPPEELFSVVAEEIARVVDVPLVRVVRYEPDGTAAEWASFSTRGPTVPFGKRSPLEGTSVLQLVRESSEAARIDDYSGLEGEIAEIARSSGIRSAAGSPIVVAGRLWGAVVASSMEQLPEGTEARLTDFTELIATAIANAESGEALAQLADEQAALRRVATLVARGAPPEELFGAVTEEVGQLLPVGSAAMGRFDPDGMFTTVAAWSTRAIAFPVGKRWIPEGKNVMTIVFETGRSARIDDFTDASGPVGVAAREAGYRSAVGTPIIVEGHLWGVMTAASTAEPLPPDTEARLASFTELVATAIANTESRAALGQLAEEQAALRRVATLVARGVRPDEIFLAVSEEAVRLFGSGTGKAGAGVVRFEHDGPAIVFVGVAKSMIEALPLGTRWKLDDTMASAEVYRTGRSARVDAKDWSSVSGPVGATARRLGIVSTVASPIIVEGRRWGAMTVSAQELLPLDTEERLDALADLAATAIANADSKSELAASRMRIVAAADEARRRIERDLHDGTQQRLVSLGLSVRTAEANVPPDRTDLQADLSRIATGLAGAIDELQEISRGIHPAVLSQGGLGTALRALERRSMIPIELDVTTDTRLPEPIEVAAYFVVSEALTNATKHAQASQIDVSLAQRNGRLMLSIRDDGVGGADPARGSGLVGLSDRVEALGGSIRVSSQPGDGTQITAELPLELGLAKNPQEEGGA